MAGTRLVSLPLWVRNNVHSECKLHEILHHLKNIPSNTATVSTLQSLGIELHKLDFQSGATCCDARSYFKPRRDVAYRFEIARTRLQPPSTEEGFLRYNELQAAGVRSDFPQQAYLGITFQAYAKELLESKEGGKEWKPILDKECRRGLVSERGQHSFQVFHGAHVIDHHQCHRQVWMQSRDESDVDQPSVAELMVLVSWMIGAMQYQQKTTRKLPRKRHIPPHHIFPTLVISFLPSSQVRMLHGYYDGTLKVQSTKAQKIDVSNYNRMMETLLYWSWPVTCARTTTIIPMPTIHESDMEHIVEKVESQPLVVVHKEWYLKRKLLSFASRRGFLYKKKDIAKKKHKGV